MSGYAWQDQLARALEAEHVQWDQWRSKGINKASEAVSVRERDRCVGWLCRIARMYSFAPDTVCLATAILDKVLNSTRVQSKYLSCLGLAALYVAAKIREENETLPHLAEMLRRSGTERSLQEVIRMERVLLNKIGWSDLNLMTPFVFIELMLVIMPDAGVIITDDVLDLVFSSLTVCLQQHNILTRFKGSALACALLYIAVLQRNAISARWCATRLAEAAKVTQEDLTAICQQVTALLAKKTVASGIEGKENAVFAMLERHAGDAPTALPVGFSALRARKRRRLRSGQEERAPRAKQRENEGSYLSIEEIYEQAARFLYAA